MLDAEWLGQDGHVGAEPARDEVVRALAALGLADHARDHDVAPEADAGGANGLGGGDHGGHAALHVLAAVAIETVPFNGGGPGVALGAEPQGVDVEVAIQHQALAGRQRP